MNLSDPARSKSLLKFVAIVLSLAILIFQFIAGVGQNARAQSNPVEWTPPQNISRSGAASQPRIFTGPGNITQVFWIDRFDGLVSSISSGAGWSKPQPVPILGGPEEMPVLVSDNSGWLHAFWQVADPNSKLSNSLYTSRMALGGTSWSPAELLAEDALTYAAYPPADGGLSLAYIRRNHNDLAPAGVYTRWLPSGFEAWGNAQNIYPSIYYRLLAQDSSSISIVDDGAGNQFVTWFDPLQNRTLIAESNDRGLTWGEPASFDEALAEGIDRDSPLRLVAIPGRVLSIRQASGINSCLLFQQQWQGRTLDISDTSNENASGSTAPPPGWSAPTQILPSLLNCPLNDQFSLDSTRQRIYWLWGQGSGSLSLSAWDDTVKQWSLPSTQSFTFQDPANGGMVALADLHAALSGNRIAVAGQSPVGEIWVTAATNPGTGLAFAPRSDWGDVQVVNPPPQPDEPNRSVNDFSLAMDDQGKAHLVYTLSDAETGARSVLGSSLVYTYWDPAQSTSEQFFDHTIELVPGEVNILLRQPSLFIDPDGSTIHLVWSGGEQGEILYSRAPLDRADSLSEWFPAQTLSTNLFNAWPQIGSDAQGTLYVVSVIPINDERGVYLFVSEDRGQTWSMGEQVFDAVAAGLPGVDHPALLVTAEGGLHIAWVESTPAGSDTAQRIFYIYSPDGGDTWNEPVVMAGPGNDWPRLALADGKLHLIFAQTQSGQADPSPSGALWQRTIDIEKITASSGEASSESGWSPAMRIPGWDQVNLPYGVTVDGYPSEGRLHLAGINSMGLILYSVWENENWSTPETVVPGMSKPTSGGLAAAARPLGDQLAVAWLAPTGTGAGVVNQPATRQETGLYFLARNITPLEISVTPTAVPTLTPTPPPQPTATTALPTPTPDLNSIPNPTGSAQAPLIIGILFPFVLVVGFFAWRIISRRRR